MADIHIMPAMPADAAPIAANLRAADRAECLAAGVTDIEGAIADGIAHSAPCWVAEVDGEPACVFGVRAMGEVGVPWMLGTEAVVAHRRAFIRLAPQYIAKMLHAHPRLMNHVHADNTRAVQWLRKAGFALAPATPHPATGAPFHVFTMEAGHV